MLTSVISLLSGAAAIVGGILAYKNSANRQRRAAEKDIAEKLAKLADKRAEIEQAVYADDDDKVNELAARILAPCCCAIVSAWIVVGCASKNAPVYIATDRRIETVTNSLGIACKAVPNAVFVELLEKAQELKDLKAEMAVDKRLQK